MFWGEVKVGVKRARDARLWHATVYDVTAEEGALPMAHGFHTDQAEAVERARSNAMAEYDVPFRAVIGAPLVPAEAL